MEKAAHCAGCGEVTSCSRPPAAGSSGSSVPKPSRVESASRTTSRAARMCRRTGLPSACLPALALAPQARVASGRSSSRSPECVLLGSTPAETGSRRAVLSGRAGARRRCLSRLAIAWCVDAVSSIGKTRTRQSAGEGAAAGARERRRHACLAPLAAIERRQWARVGEERFAACSISVEQRPALAWQQDGRVWGSASTRLTRCAVSTGRGQVPHTCSACIPSVAGLLLQQKARCSIFGGQHSNASAMHAAAGSSAARAWPRRPRTRRRGWRRWRARESLGVSCRRGGLHGLPRPWPLAGTPHAAAACLGLWPNVYWASRNAAARQRGRRGHMSDAARWTLGVRAIGLRCTSSRRAGTPAGTTSLVAEEPGSERGCVGAVGKSELPHAASPSVAAATPKRPRQGAGRAPRLQEARPCLRAQRTKKMLKHPGVQCKRWRLTGSSGRKALRGPLDPGVWTRPNAIPWRPAPDRYCTAFYWQAPCASASDLRCGKGRCANQINRHAPPASPASHGPPRPHAAAGSGGTSERNEAEASAAV